MTRGVVGIDVGGTKTHLVLARGGEVEGEHLVTTATWRTGVTTRDAQALVGIVRDRWGETALALPIGLGAHGCDSTEQCLAMQAELASRTSGGVRVTNDAELMTWAMGVPKGIGLVAGTGSIAVARDDDHQLITAGGWGWVLGDEGSAAGIVRESVRAALDALDHGRRSDPLVPGLLGGFAVRDGAELAMALTSNSSAHFWGSHAKLVFTAADLGSPLAIRVISTAGEALAALVGRLRARGVSSTDLVAGGGVLVSQQRLRVAFLAALSRSEPALRVRILNTAPVLGAVALAESIPLTTGDDAGRTTPLAQPTPTSPHLGAVHSTPEVTP